MNSLGAILGDCKHSCFLLDYTAEWAWLPKISRAQSALYVQHPLPSNPGYAPVPSPPLFPSPPLLPSLPFPSTPPFPSPSPFPSLPLPSSLSIPLFTSILPHQGNSLASRKTMVYSRPTYWSVHSAFKDHYSWGFPYRSSFGTSMCRWDLCGSYGIMVGYDTCVPVLWTQHAHNNYMWSTSVACCLQPQTL